MRINPVNFTNYFILSGVHVGQKWQLFGNQKQAGVCPRLWGIPDSWIRLLGHIISPTKYSEMKRKTVLHKETSSCLFLRVSVRSWAGTRKPCNRKARKFTSWIPYPPRPGRLAPRRFTLSFPSFPSIVFWRRSETLAAFLASPHSLTHSHGCFLSTSRPIPCRGLCVCCSPCGECLSLGFSHDRIPRILQLSA